MAWDPKAGLNALCAACAFMDFMSARFVRPALAAALLVATPGHAQPPPAYPATPQHPVTDTFYGVQVTDSYRWLEDVSNPDVKAWVAAQNRFTRSILDASPTRAQLSQELAAAFSRRPVRYDNLQVAGGRLFAIKAAPQRQQPELVVFASPDGGDEKVLLDPITLDPTGAVAIDFYRPSHDGKLVAVSLSRGGSESGDLHVFEVETGRERMTDFVIRVNGGTAGGDVAWNADNTGFYYTRYPHAGERDAEDLSFYQQVYFHRLGTPVESDRRELGDGFPRIAEITFVSSDDGSHVVARVANGDGGEFKFYYKILTGTWQPLAGYADQITDVNFGSDNSLYLLSRQNAPLGKLLHLEVGDSALAKAHVVVPEGSASITGFAASGDRLYASFIEGGPSSLAVYSASGHSQGSVPLEGIVSVHELVPVGKHDVLFRTSGYLSEPRWLRYSGPKKLAPLSINAADLVSFADAEVVRDVAISKDGTRVPVNIIRKRGLALDGTHHVVLYGYGGYAISLEPEPIRALRLLLDHGFVYVVANLRGGGEYGEKWHQAGQLKNKQNVFDDFYACAKYLVEHHYTTPDHLAIMGGSNGGLLMGAAMTQHPEMYRVVLAFVGIYDMLHVELSPNGAFNVTEFGTVKEQDQFRALFAYSPFHHVVPGARYPAAIFLTGDNDPRVDPANSRKMVAALQNAGPTKGPILLRTTSNAGHGIGSALSEVVAQYTDAFSFLFDQLGVR
jgi:prolyl oligopeptidase